MKHALSLALACVLLFSLAPFALTAPLYTDISQLDEDKIYTKEDMLAIYELGYQDGYQAGVNVVNADKSLISQPSSTTTNNSVVLDYVLNNKTMKFHFPDCSSVGKIKDSNKGYFTGTREEIIAKGYDPCGVCHP